MSLPTGARLGSNTESEMPRCAFCAATALAPWLHGVTDRLGHVQGFWSFWRCQRCRAAVLYPAPEPEELSKLYPEVYSFHAAVGRTQPFALLALLEDWAFFQAQYRSQMRAIERVVGKPKAGARLLDLGSGVGQRLRAFRRVGYDVHGLDFLPAVVEHLRTELNIDATCGDLQNLDRLFPERAFDVVTAFQVVEHVHDARPLIRSCRRLLRPGGWLVASTPMADSVQANVLGSRWCSAREAPRHLNLPSHAGLETACRDAGFANVVIRPDTLLSCAALIGLSVVPEGTTTNVYGKSSPSGLAMWGAAAAVTLASVPAVVVENYFIRRPGTVIAFAQRR